MRQQTDASPSVNISKAVIPSPPISTTGEHTVLIVDDTPTNLSVVNEHLKSCGFRTLIASNGEVALTRAQHGKPHLILLDVMMPGMDGFETCKRLKMMPETSGIPVIFMTALTETENKVRGFQCGAVDYITKPIEYEELVMRVTTHLSIYELTNRLETQVALRTDELQAALEREQNLSVQLQATLKREQGLSKQLRVSLDRETELVRMKTQVLNVVSHEFRTPLCVISNSAHLLIRNGNQLPQERKEVTYQRMEQAISYLTELVDSSLVANKMHEQSEDVRPTPIDLAIFFQKYIAEIQELNTHKIVETYDGFDGHVEVDVALVRRVLANLLGNAQKFSPEDVPIQFNAQIIDRATLMISVQDEGIGVPDHDQTIIFEALQRGSNVGTIRGLGLGLFIAKNAVAAMGGKIYVESAGNGKGSRFIVTLPVKMATKL